MDNHGRLGRRIVGRLGLDDGDRRGGVHVLDLGADVDGNRGRPGNGPRVGDGAGGGSIGGQRRASLVEHDLVILPASYGPRQADRGQQPKGNPSHCHRRPPRV
jgi:hypothetical protein